MSSKLETTGKTASTRRKTAEVSQAVFDRQKAYFATDLTKTYEWRIDQIDRLIRMLKENDKRFSEASKSDFKTALQENIFDRMLEIYPDRLNPGALWSSVRKDAQGDGPLSRPSAL